MGGSGFSTVRAAALAGDPGDGARRESYSRLGAFVQSLIARTRFEGSSTSGAGARARKVADSIVVVKEVVHHLSNVRALDVLRVACAAPITLAVEDASDGCDDANGAIDDGGYRPVHLHREPFAPLGVSPLFRYDVSGHAKQVWFRSHDMAATLALLATEDGRPAVDDPECDFIVAPSRSLATPGRSWATRSNWRSSAANASSSRRKARADATAEPTACSMHRGCAGRARLHGFEPQAHLFRLLERNALVPRAHLWNAASICESSTEGVRMHETFLDGSSHAAPVGPRYGTADRCNFGGLTLGAGGEPVTTWKLDDLLDAIDDLGFIHSDAQGAEPFAFWGARELLRRDRPTIAFERAPWFTDHIATIHPHVPREVHTFDVIALCVDELGYRTAQALDDDDFLVAP